MSFAEYSSALVEEVRRSTPANASCIISAEAAEEWLTHFWVAAAADDAQRAAMVKRLREHYQLRWDQAATRRASLLAWTTSWVRSFTGGGGAIHDAEMPVCFDAAARELRELAMRFPASAAPLAQGAFAWDVLPLRAGGEGLNLQQANRIFVLEPWWNPAVENQAIQRAHRIGQTRVVRATRFVTKDSIEERMFELQEKKQLVFEGTVEAKATALAQLTEEDLRFLFK